jgi:hypothetical protein
MYVVFGGEAEDLKPLTTFAEVQAFIADKIREVGMLAINQTGAEYAADACCLVETLARLHRLLGGEDIPGVSAAFVGVPDVH